VRSAFDSARSWFSLSRSDSKSPKPKSTPSLAFLDGFLSGRLSADGRMGLLQCGANDGITVDPVRSFLLRNPGTVSAVLVEPLPDVYASLQANYAGHDHVVTLNVAVGPGDSLELHRIKPAYAAHYHGAIASGVTSFDRDFVLAKATKLLRLEGVAPEDRIETFTQRCLTVSAIIDAHADLLGERPFLQVDAEGFDDRVIYTVDFERHRPIAINYEVQNLGEDRQVALRRHLSDIGYSFVRWSKSDEIAIGS